MNNKKVIYIIIGILVAAIIINFVAKYMAKPTPAEKAGGTGTSTKKWEVLKDVPSGLTAEKGSKVVIDGITYEYNGTQWGRYL